MAIDYSKWDKLEISDDSDIEVHPNVDKRSFIKWKQRDIHEKRQQRNIEIKSILVQLTMYAELNKRVDHLLENLEESKFVDTEAVMEVVNDKFDKAQKFDYEDLKQTKGDTLRKGLKDLKFDPEEYENTPPYNEMIEDLFIQIKEDHPEAKEDAAKILELVKEHRRKIDDILSKSAVKMDDLLNQKAQLISSEDIHTGFDRSFMNKDPSEGEQETGKASTETQKVTTTEVINTPKSVDTDSVALSQSTDSVSEKDALEDLVILPETERFSHIDSNDLEASARYLLQNTKICNEGQKDALIMTAFDHQLEGNSEKAKQVIHQSLLLQYIAQLAGPHPPKEQIIKAIGLFCTKVKSNSSPARDAFLQDVENTFNHIKTRCKIIEQEHNEKTGNDEEAQIQLKSLDDTTELVVNLPESNTDEWTVFSTELPKEMQDAVKTKSLEEVNRVLATYKVEEAERILDVFSRCGVISISGYIENEKEFEDLQKQYNEEAGNYEEDESDQRLSSKLQELDTTDIVD